ncbi:hypothetical protein, partial [Methylobacterium sp. Leaf93]|uniref:hypothetical protein n=1 Tax=Methylobacterium sp. Leaf93 TaxID=1736249 RepID=UPI001AEC1921
TTLIGWVCKRGDALSLPVLIARLNLIALVIHVRDLVRQPQGWQSQTDRSEQTKRQHCLPNALSCAGLVV